MRLTPSQLNDRGFRVSFASWMFYLPIMAFLMPGSLAAMATWADVATSCVALTVTSFAGALMFTDVIMNWKAIRWQWITKYRSVLYLSGAFMALVIPLSVIRSNGINESGTYFYVLIWAKGMWLYWVNARAIRRARHVERP